MDKVRIPVENLPVLQKKFEALGRRANKLNLSSPKLLTHETVKVQYYQKSDGSVVELSLERVLTPDQQLFVFSREFIFVSCEGVAPVVDGWKLVSVIDHNTNKQIGNLISNVPGMETPLQYRDAAPVCEHCNHKRVRSQTFLLLKDGVYKQIGRNCLADFCRSEEYAQELISSASWNNSAESSLSEESLHDMSRGISLYQLRNVLALTNCLIRTFGWTPRAAAQFEGTVSTCSQVCDVMFNPSYRKYNPELAKAVDSFDPELDYKKADEAIAWIRSKEDQKRSLGDYLYNLLVVAIDDQIESKRFGLACSMIAAMNREKEGEIQRAAKTEKKISQYFGTVSKREEFKLKVVGLHYFDTDWGTTTLVRFNDEQGNVAVWKSSSGVDFEIGKDYLVVGSVKEHSEWKDIKQTVLTRCKYRDA